jgi:hypothetical protein
MERITYQPTASQTERWERMGVPVVPSDESFKAASKRGGKPWGLRKRDFILGAMTSAREYQMGIWQGRVDAARELSYSEERSESTYNLGYYRGYTGYQSDRNGWDAQTRERFDAQYVKN